MAGSSGDLYAAAAELLAAAEVALTDTPAGCPAYRAIWPGRPTFDCCPAVFVHVGGADVGGTLPLVPSLQPMQRMVTTGLVELVALTVTVIRCVPVIEQQGQLAVLPEVPDIQAAAATIHADLWAIWNYFVHAHRDGILFQYPSGRREFILDPAVAIVTSGGAGGWQIPVRVQLAGYRPGVLA